MWLASEEVGQADLEKITDKGSTGTNLLIIATRPQTTWKMYLEVLILPSYKLKFKLMRRSQESINKRKPIKNQNILGLSL